LDGSIDVLEQVIPVGKSAASKEILGSLSDQY
jgi:hypothetical protein